MNMKDMRAQACEKGAGGTVSTTFDQPQHLGKICRNLAKKISGKIWSKRCRFRPKILFPPNQNGPIHLCMRVEGLVKGSNEGQYL